MPKKTRGVAGIENGDRGPKRFDFPETLDLERAARDAEILAGKLRDEPDRLREVLQAVKGGDKRSAVRGLKELGMSEEDFEREGGGLFWLVVIVVLLYATDAY